MSRLIFRRGRRKKPLLNLLAIGLGLGWLLGLGAGVWLALINGFAHGPYSGALILAGVPCLFFALAGLLVSALLSALARLARPGSAARAILLRPRLHAAVICAGFLGWALNGLRYGEPWFSAWNLLGLSWVIISPALIALAIRKGKSSTPHPARFLTGAGLVLPILFCITFTGDYLWLTRSQAQALQNSEMGLSPAFVPARGPFPPSNGQRVIVLGFDAATWDRIDPLIAQGKLPNFKRLQAEGATGRLHTLTPTLSAMIWTSIATGFPPEVHGIQGQFEEQAPLLQRDKMKFPSLIRAVRDLLIYARLIRKVPVTSAERRVKALWNMASEAGRTVNVSGWWGTWPPEAVAGVMVSDRANYAFLQSWVEEQAIYNLPTGTYTYPPEFLRRLDPYQRDLRRLPEAELERFAHLDDRDRQELSHPESLAKDDPLFYLAITTLPNAFYLEVSQFLLQQHPADLNLFYFNLLDLAGHFFGDYAIPGQTWSKSDPRFKDTLDDYYIWADEILGQFLAQADSRTTLLVVSDHGFEIEPKRYGHDHAPDGIIACFGAQARTGARIASASVLDIAPTVLFLLGLPQGQDMPGHVIQDCIAPERLAAQVPAIKSWEVVPRPGTQPLLSGQEDQMMKQLKALGYTK